MFQGRNITIGSWVVYGLPAGLGVREDMSSVTNNDSTFIPHLVSNKDYKDIREKNLEKEEEKYHHDGLFHTHEEFDYVYKPNLQELVINKNQEKLR